MDRLEASEHQDGVITRAQVLGAGYDDNTIERMLRRREWARVHRGVYVDHTGPLTWHQRAWAAVLYYWPAALSHESAIPQGTSTADHELIHVGVDHARAVSHLPGVRTHRLRNLTDRAQWNLSPPRMRYDEALLDVCARARTRLDALALAANACQQGRTTAERLLEALAGRDRLRHGNWLRGALEDVAEGALSVLEHAYLNRVERAHGLPRGRRQEPGRHHDTTVYRDVDYAKFGLLVELDGRLGHADTRGRDRDMDRDLDVAADGGETVRLSWGQCIERPCRTAGRVARLLRRRGWPGSPRSCGPGCTLCVEFPACGAENSTHKGPGP